MTDILALGAALLVVFIAGGNILFLVALVTKRDGLRILEKAALAFGIGLSAISVEMLAIAMLNLRFNPGLIAAPWLGLIVLNAALFVFRGKGIVNENRRQLNDNSAAAAPLKVILSLMIAAEAAYALFKALIKPLESYDALAIYAIKAKALFTGLSIPSGFFGRLYGFAHPDYPLHIPLSETFIYVFLGSLNDQLVKIIFPLYFFALLAIFFCAVRRFAGSLTALLFTYVLASVPQLNEYAANGYVDLALSFYVFSAAAFLFYWFRDPGSWHNLIISSIMSACAVWTKNEGIMYLGVLLAVMSVFLLTGDKRPFSRRIGSALLWVSVVAAILAPWAYVRASNDLVNTDVGTLVLDPLKLSGRFLDKLGPVLYEFQKQALGPKKWNILWPVLLAALVLRRKIIAGPAGRYAALFLALAVCGYVYIYVSSPLDINFFLSKTWARFLLHFLPVAVYLMAYSLKDDIKV